MFNVVLTVLRPSRFYAYVLITMGDLRLLMLMMMIIST